MLGYNYTISTELKGLSLHFLSSDEIHKLSVSEIKNIGYVGHESANKSCIYDPSLGSSDIYKICKSCNEMSNCNGHLGHIDFAVPVYHPLMLPSLCRLLKMTCFGCRRLRLNKNAILKYIKLFELCNVGLLSDMLLLDQILKTSDQTGFEYTSTNVNDITKNTKEQKNLTIKRILRRLYRMKNKLIPNRLGILKNKSTDNRLEHNDTTINEEYHHLSSYDIIAWNEIRNKLFNEGIQTSECPYCGNKSKLSIKPSSDSSCIDISWPQSNKEPSFIKGLNNTNIQNSNCGINEKHSINMDIVNMLNSEFTSQMSNILNVTGISIRLAQLQAFHMIPILIELFQNHLLLLTYLFPQSKVHGWKIFIMDCMSVSANRFRPPLVTAEKQIVLHARSSAILDIIVVNEFLKLLLKIKNHINIKDIFRNEKYISDLLGYTIDQKQLKQFQELIYGGGMSFNTALLNNTLNLQRRISSYMDNNKPTGNLSLPPKPGIKQSMEHKTGTIRQNMLGKRVNYSARTVIAPDCFMDTNQMGIPLKFAMELTIPEYVTRYNVNLLRRLIINGSKIYPGANFLRDSNGKLYNLSALNANERAAKAKLLLTGITEGDSPRIVYRHVLDGDVVLMNRQPTLHKPGIMGHFVKVLTNQKIFRLNYVNCNTYNADFDGDEMNLHLPQDYLSQAEAQIIANADCQFVVPKNGQPIRGLIQDHCQGGALLTSKDTFLRKNEYYNLVYISLNHILNNNNNLHLRDGDKLQSIYENIKLDNELYQFTKKFRFSSDHFARKFSNLEHEIYIDKPAIFYPEMLWTGKQVITSILKTLVDGISCGLHNDTSFLKHYNGINLISKSQTPGDAWGGSNDGNTEESTIIIKNSELLQGVLDKSQFGASSYGLTHLVYEILGPRVCGMLLNSFSYLFTSFLQMHGATCSPKDFLLTLEGENFRRSILRRIKYGGLHIQELFISSISNKYTKAITSDLTPNSSIDDSVTVYECNDPFKKILFIMRNLIEDINNISDINLQPIKINEYNNLNELHLFITEFIFKIKEVGYNDKIYDLISTALDEICKISTVKCFVYPYIMQLKHYSHEKIYPGLLERFPSWLSEDFQKQCSINYEKNLIS